MQIVTCIIEICNKRKAIIACNLKGKWGKKIRKRKMSHRKYRRFVSRFKPLALRPRLHRVKGFYYSLIPRDHHYICSLKNESGPASPLTHCLLHLTIVELASSNETSTFTLLLYNNEENDLLKITKIAHKSNPITKSGFLALRFMVGKDCTQSSVRIKSK